VIDVADDSLNRVAPVDDPGWSNVGNCRGLTAVYLGGGWVLTARHVGAGDISLKGKLHTLVEGSRQVIRGAPDVPANADLLLFQVEPEPRLPVLALAKTVPEIGDSIMMIGKGRGRGDPIGNNAFNGFNWNQQAIMRWGTGMVHGHRFAERVGVTKVFSTRFSIAKTRYESQAAVGDSGGAAFIRGGEGWELAGIILAIETYGGQSGQSAVYGNKTLIADLAFYRDVIHRIIGRSVNSKLPEEPPAAGSEGAE
jgi:hypothetical protein